TITGEEDDRHLRLAAEPGQRLSPFTMVQVLVHQGDLASMVLQDEACLKEALRLDRFPGIQCGLGKKLLHGFGRAWARGQKNPAAQIISRHEASPCDLCVVKKCTE